MAHEWSGKPSTSGRTSNSLPSAERYSAQSVLKAVRVAPSGVALTYMAPDTASRMPFVTREQNMNNQLPSTEQYGVRTIGKAVDEWRDE